MVILQIGPVGEFLAMQSNGGGCQWTPDPKTNSSELIIHRTSPWPWIGPRCVPCGQSTQSRPLCIGVHGRRVS